MQIYVIIFDYINNGNSSSTEMSATDRDMFFLPAMSLYLVPSVSVENVPPNLSGQKVLSDICYLGSHYEIAFQLSVFLYIPDSYIIRHIQKKGVRLKYNM